MSQRGKFLCRDEGSGGDAAGVTSVHKRIAVRVSSFFPRGCIYIVVFAERNVLIRDGVSAQ